MELNEDLIAIQSLLNSVVKQTGEFVKIKYKGGNETKINQIVKELDDYLTSKHYINKRVSNKMYSKELEDITCFLILNLDFEDDTVTDIKEFAHLVNIIPKLSKCLLANTVVELDLNEYYCHIMQYLPAELAEELLSEIIPCIKKSKASDALTLVYIYMKNIIMKISSIDSANYKMTECIEKLENISSEILLTCSGINPDQMEGWKKTRVYQHMGQTLFCLLKLLLHCQVENEALFKIIDDLINSVCVVMKAVTVDVFCTWAEVDHKNAPLQTVIGEEAYHVIEKYQKYESAKPLIQMIGSIAKKPKSLNEMIQEADTATMILKIEQNPVDRKKWFKALLNTQVFKSKESKECINRWANLCTIEDLGRLLNLSVYHKNEEDVVDLIIKCASFFSEQELVIVMTRFFYQHGLKNCLKSKNTAQQLTIILNKLEKSNVKEPIKDVLLLILQDPETVLSTLYKECIKNDILLQSLEATFLSIGEIIAIEKLFINILMKILEENKFDSNNVENYKKLITCIAKSNHKILMHDFLLVQLYKNMAEEHCEDLNFMFYIYKDVVNRTSVEETDELIHISTNILEKCRWRIFDFTHFKANACQQAIEILSDFRCLRFSAIEDEKISSLKQVLNRYYLMQLRNGTELDFLDVVCPHFKIEKSTEAVAYFIKLLPQCVATEWIAIANIIIKKQKFESGKFIEVLTNALMVTSQVVKTQSNDHVCVVNGLRFCIQNYGLILKDVILPLNNEETNEIMVRNVCRLIRDMPTEIVDVEGMSLISLIPDQVLKSMKKDESLLTILLSMKGSKISCFIAKRIVE